MRMKDVYAHQKTAYGKKDAAISFSAAFMPFQERHSIVMR